jgi:pyruvate/2-oxoglutarate dehydrogenase complex dihydrolipoamide acyltransferase (E2) component
VIYHADHNIGVAMDTSRGLMVPVLKNVQDKSILQVAKVREGGGGG